MSYDGHVIVRCYLPINLPNFGFINAQSIASLVYGMIPTSQGMFFPLDMFMVILNLLVSSQFKEVVSFFMTPHQFHINNVLSNNCIST